MLKEANNLCRRLWRDESGVVLVLTMVVFLTLFVISCTVYAAGENIRQRIELQNAADAAAYSAAVVQADALSRVAAINKAMAWTYVQMGRAVMDYDLDVWLELTLNRWRADYAQCLGQISPYSSCYLTYMNSWIGTSPLGYYPNCQWNGMIRINSNRLLPYAYLYNTWMFAPNHWSDLQGKIDGYRSSIKGMNAAEASIIAALQGHIQDTVRYVLQRNTGYPNQQDYAYSLLSNRASDYFSTLTDESRLLRFFDSPGDASTLFGPGIDVWFRLQESDSIQRGYQQQTSCLRSDWRWHLEGWIWTHWGPLLVYRPPDGSDTVWGSDGKQYHDPSLYYQTEPVKSQVLTDAYFGQKGAIVVGVARRMTNPLGIMAADSSNPGLFGFFFPASTDGKERFAWAAAASRAGYRDSDDGEYNTKGTASWLTSGWNLSQTDWDAELIPLQWWMSTSGKPALQQFWESEPWQPLFADGPSGNGLGSFASGDPPSRMGGQISFADKGVVLH